VLAGDVYSDAKFTGGPGDHSTDVGRGAEPQLPTEGETGGQGLRDQQPDSTVACGDGRRVVKKGAGIEHLKDLGAVPVNPFEADSSRNHWLELASSFGLLIHTVLGSAGGSGGLRTKRSGCAA